MENEETRPRHHFLVSALLGLTMALAPIMLLLGAIDAHMEDRYAATVFELVVYGWIVVLFMLRNTLRTDTLSWNYALMMVTLGVGCSYWYVDDPLPHLFIITAIPVAGMMLGWRGGLTIFGLAAAGLTAIALYFMEVQPAQFDLTYWVSTSLSCLVVGAILGGAGSKLHEAIRAVPDPVTIRDYKRERQLERQLAMAERDRALGGLARAVAHDFNNLLTPIIASAEMAQMTVDDPEVRDDLSAIMLASSQARALVRTVLEFQRSDTAITEVEVSESVADIFHLATHGMPDSLRHPASLVPGCVVSARRSDIQRIVMNLVTNAARAVEEDGEVELKVYETSGKAPRGALFVGAFDDECRYVTIEVTDDGKGIEPDKLDRIFEPFVTFSDGTGLGLSTVREIVEELRGCVFVDSSVEVGTSFYVLIPCVGESGIVAPTPERELSVAQ